MGLAPLDWFDNFGERDDMAFEHFAKRKIAYDEAGILDVLRAPRSKYDVYWSTLALSELGSARSLPALKELVHYPMRDVQGGVALTIAYIARGQENAFLASLVASPAYREKWYAMLALLHCPDASGVTDVLAYSLRATKGGKSIEKNPCCGLDWLYLARFAADDAQAQAIFAKVRANMDFLPPATRDGLIADCPQVFGVDS